MNEEILNRCNLYLQKAPKYLQDIANYFIDDVYVFINWDVKNPNIHGFVDYPDDYDTIKKVAIILNPYSFAWKVEDCRNIFCISSLDVRDVVICVLLHEVGHYITKSPQDIDANNWAKSKLRYVKNNFNYPHKNNNSTFCIEENFNLELLEELTK